LFSAWIRSKGIAYQKKSKSALHKEIKKYENPGRNPERAIDGMYGLWEAFVAATALLSTFCSDDHQGRLLRPVP
jgi:hypothetical protein